MNINSEEGYIVFMSSSILSEESSLRKSRKNAENKVNANVRSAQPIISRILCMDSCGIPRSTARIPVF